MSYAQQINVMANGWMDEIEDMVPTLIPVSNSVPFLYAGESHAISGPGGSGKSWLAAYCLLVMAKQRKPVVFLDYESNMQVLKARLLALGASIEDAAYIYYWRIDVGVGKNTTAGREWLEWLDARATDTPIALVVIDSVARGMSAAGLDDNDNGQFRAWNDAVIVPLEQRGITSLRIDHTGYGSETRSRGASSKLQATGGADFSLRPIKGWSRSSSGAAEIVVLKDRHGAREVGTKLVMSVEVLPSGVSIALSAAPDGALRPTGVREKVIQFIERNPKCTVRQIREGVRAQNGAIDLALTELVEGGFVARVEEGRSKVHTACKSFGLGIVQSSANGVGDEEAPFELCSEF